MGGSLQSSTRARLDARRQGRSLTDLIVFLAIVVFLVGLLLAALGAMSRPRSVSRTSWCRNNQRNISMALLRYELDQRHYPGWCVNQNPDANGLGGREASWVFAIAPLIDRSDIYDYYGSQQQGLGKQAKAPQEMLKLLHCPGTAYDLPAGEMATSYVVNTGYYQDGRPYRDRAEAASVGLCTYQYRASPSDRLTYVGAGSVTDGLSQTLLLTENADAGTWLGRAVTGDTTDRVEEGCVGFTWGGRDPIPAINFGIGTATDCTAARVGPAMPRPSSFHEGGVIATFADGHNEFLSETIDPSVYHRLCTPRRQIVDFEYQPTAPQEPLRETEY